MPEYSWVCEQCTHQMTKRISITKYNPREKVYCPNCGTEARRKIEQVGLSFGKGFFRDGYESAKNVKTNTDGES
jgi:putative FmdB family regulatory protein